MKPPPDPLPSADEIALQPLTEQLDLGRRLSIVGRFKEAKVVLEAVMPRLEAAGMDKERIKGFLSLFDCETNLNDLKAALQHAQNGLTLAQQLKDEAMTSWLQNAMGIVHRLLGNLPTALEFFKASLQQAKGEQKNVRVASALGNMANTYDMLGQHESARELNLEALALVRALNDTRNVALILGNLAAVERSLDYPREQILAHYDEALSLLQAEGMEGLGRPARGERVRTLVELGRAEEALAYANEVIAALPHEEVTTHLCVLWRGKALALKDLGRMEEALTAIEFACECSQKIAEVEMQTTLLQYKAEFLYACKRPEEAYQTLLQSTEKRASYLTQQAEEKATNLRIALEVEEAHRQAQAERQRRQQMEALNEEIRAQNDVLAQLNDERDEIMGVVAHDLVNPLHALREGLRVLSPQNPKDEKFWEELQLSANHATAMVKDLLARSHFELGKKQGHLTRLDLAGEIKTAIARWAPEAERQQLVIAPRFPSHTLYTHSESRLTQRVLDNILSNAFKYSPAKGRIEIVLVDAEKGPILKIRDQGPGLSPERQANLFQTPLTSAAQDHPSTGLGLFLTSRILQRMGGRIEYDSQPGQGATFVIHWPKAACDDNESPAT